MRHQPLKRVGAPTSFKGIRGPFLIEFLKKAGLILLAVIVTMPFPIDVLFRSIIILGALTFILVLFDQLKRKSKGDIYANDKKKSRKYLRVKGKPLR